MKTLSQLLELSKNPFYKFMPEEQAVLDDFFSKKQATRLKRLTDKKSKDSLGKTNVTVRNIVKTVDTYPPDSL